MSNDLFVKARSKLVLDNPFFGTLCLRLTPKETDQLPTGATDGVSLLYNPKWFEVKVEQNQQLLFVKQKYA